MIRNTLHRFKNSVLVLNAVVMIAVLLVSGPSPLVLALTSGERANLFRPFYDKNSSFGCADSSQLVGDGEIEKIYNFLISKGLTNIQVTALMANLQAESGFEPRKVEYGKRNTRGEISKAGEPSSLDDNIPVNETGGYGLAMWTAGRKDNLHAAAVKQGVKGSELDFQLNYLWGELTGSYYERLVLTPLKQMTSLNDATDLVLLKFEGPLVPNYDERRTIAISLFDRFSKNIAPVTDTVASSTPSGCGIASNGSVIQAALDYSWPDSGHGKLEGDAKPSYQTAMPQYNGSKGLDPFSDCGVFVSTVMITSGADPSYPKRGTTDAQLPYLLSSGKYLEIKTTNTADLRPGDIFITPGHTYLYVGPQGDGKSIAAASLGDHVPELGGQAFFSDTSNGVTRTYQVFRLK